MSLLRSARRTATHMALGLASLLPALAPAGAQPRGTIAGTVTNAATGAPIADAKVIVRGRKDAASTDSAGRYTLSDVPPGTLIMQVRAIGFASASRIVDVSGQGTTVQDVALSDVQELGEVVVQAQEARVLPHLREFEDRRRRGRGQFVTAEEIHKSNVSTLTDVLRRLRGVQYTCQGTECFVHMSRSPVGCLPQYIVDGRPQKHFGPSTALNDIAGVEVYVGPSETPAEYVGEGGCGTIVIWTKSAP